MSGDNLFRTIDSRYGRLTYFANDIGAVSQSLETYGEWAENELTFMKTLIPPGATVVDVGAYIGTHTIAFAQAVGSQGRVISIEPQDATFALLEKNVAANQLRNVQLKHAAAADHIGTLWVSPIRVTEKKSFGSAALDRSNFPLAHIGSGPNLQKEELMRVQALTIDSLHLDSCALVKIDVEGFEDLVIAGATETLKRLSPVIYAECNAVENGLKTFEMMRELGYTVRLHVVDAFNQHNFLGREENIFGPAREAALVGVKGTHLAKVDQMQARPCELILKIATADDLVLGMLNKPQYACEILQSGVAARSGGDAWLRERSAALSERDEARELVRWAKQEASQARAKAEAAREMARRAQLDASQARAEAEGARAGREAAMREAHQARDAANQVEAKLADLLQRHENLRASLDEADANLVRAQAEITQLNQRLIAMWNSHSWRITKPLRAAMSYWKSFRGKILKR